MDEQELTGGNVAETTEHAAPQSMATIVIPKRERKPKAEIKPDTPVDAVGYGDGGVYVSIGGGKRVKATS